MRLKTSRKALRTRRPFATSREVKTSVENVFVRVDEGGTSGWGEASPLRYFGETPERIESQLQAFEGEIEAPPSPTPAGIAAALEAACRIAPLSPAARCALDLALWDWASRASGKSIAALRGLPDPGWEAVESGIAARGFRTLGLMARAEWDSALADLEGCTRIKVKWSRETDPDLLPWLRERGVRDILVDANAGLTLVEAEALLPAWEAARIVALEQPFPPERDEDSGILRKRAPFPLIADESVRDLADLEAARPHFDAINIKLVKAGGLSASLRLAEAARSQGLRLMVGCMLESSLLIRAGACLAEDAEWVDLDGNLWLAADPAAKDGQTLGWGVRL